MGFSFFLSLSRTDMKILPFYIFGRMDKYICSSCSANFISILGCVLKRAAAVTRRHVCELALDCEVQMYEERPESKAQRVSQDCCGSNRKNTHHLNALSDMLPESQLSASLFLSLTYMSLSFFFSIFLFSILSFFLHFFLHFFLFLPYFFS